MRPARKLWPVLLTACVAIGADDSAWKTKSMAQWSADDAKQILADSPWSKTVTPQWVRDLSPDERRISGDLQADRGHGVGLAGTGLLGPEREAEAIRRAHEKPDPGAFLVRWESARPVRTAEKKAGANDAPEFDDSEYYAIAIYNIPTPKRWNLANELKGIAALRRYQKKDLKPAQVVITRNDDETATILYLFPRSEEITKRDITVVFYAQVGRLFVTQAFSVKDMQIRDQLEL